MAAQPAHPVHPPVPSAPSPAIPASGNGPDRPLLVNGAAILTLGLVAGFTIPLAARPETVLSAHVIGIAAGALAIVVGLALPQAQLSPGWARVLRWTLLPSLYLGFLTQWLGGMMGLSRMFVVTAAGLPEGAAWAERAVELVVKGISPLTVLPVLILGWGFARRA